MEQTGNNEEDETIKTLGFHRSSNCSFSSSSLSSVNKSNVSSKVYSAPRRRRPAARRETISPESTHTALVVILYFKGRLVHFHETFMMCNFVGKKKLSAMFIFIYKPEAAGDRGCTRVHVHARCVVLDHLFTNLLLSFSKAKCDRGHWDILQRSCKRPGRCPSEHMWEYSRTMHIEDTGEDVHSSSCCCELVCPPGQSPAVSLTCLRQTPVWTYSPDST